MSALRIALIGDHNPGVTAHRAIPEALARAGAGLGAPVTGIWMGTETLAHGPTDRLTGCNGIWCVPASPYRSEAGALAAIRYARESGRPFLGTCGGFQHALLEYARNVLGLRAVHAESTTTTVGDVAVLIAPLSCGLVEVTGEVRFVPGSRLAAWHGSESAVEGYHCSYGLNPKFEGRLTSGSLRVTARDAAGEVRAMELDGHPFYVLTLYQPERAALAGRAHPIVNAFVAAARAEAPARR